MQIMDCNGKMWPLSNEVNFDIIVFGSQQRGKVRVSSNFDKMNN